MAAGNACNTYLNAHYEGMDPKQLILMLYDGALKFIRLAKEGVTEKDARKRGENLGKVIAIIAELNSCLDPTIRDESLDFLRSLYSTMLTELPKVSVNNDTKTLDLTATYLMKLREIWVHDVMGRKRETMDSARRIDPRKVVTPHPAVTAPKPIGNPNYASGNGYGNPALGLKRKAISA